jgi:cell division septum initiation protein DivIVA
MGENEQRVLIDQERGRIVGIVHRFVSNAWESAQVTGHIENPGQYAREFGVYPTVADSRRTAFELEAANAELRSMLAQARSECASMLDQQQAAAARYVADETAMREALAALEDNHKFSALDVKAILRRALGEGS